MKKHGYNTRIMKISTKSKIIKIAIHEFASKGYDLATTRDILDQAGANAAAISYYFNGKQGLYVEILMYLVEVVRKKFRNLYPQYLVLKASMPNPQKSKDMLKTCIRAFVELICSDELSLDLTMIYIREYTQPSPFFETLSEGINKIYFPWFTTLLQDASEGALSEKEANLQAVMLYAQILTVLTRKEVILKAMDWEDYNKEAIDQILSIIYRNVGIK